MKQQIKIIPLPAMGKARPRVTRNGTFMPKRYEKWRQDFRLLFGPVEVEGVIALSVKAVRKLPKRTKHKRWDYCTTGPDADNILGAIMDSLFEDDSRVVSARCIKVWGKEDLLEVYLTEVGGLD